MYVFAHLFAGVVIGLALMWIFKRRILFWAAALGSILPDLIDKPLGLIVLHSSVNNGRIYFHSLIAVAVVLLIGLVLIGIGRIRAGKSSRSEGDLPGPVPVKPQPATVREYRTISRPGGRRPSESVSDNSHLPPTIQAALREGVQSGRAARTSAITRDSPQPGDTAGQQVPPVPGKGWRPYGSLRHPAREERAAPGDMAIISGGIHSARPAATVPDTPVPEKTGRAREGSPPGSPRTGLAGLILVAVALGMLSHQLLDSMWLERVNWFWPFLGKFQPKFIDNFWLIEFWGEVRNPAEWVFGALVIVITVAMLLHWKLRGSSPR